MPLAGIADAVVVDSSPLGATAEVLELIPAADIVVMVVRIDHTFTDTAIRAIKVVRSLTDVPMLAGRGRRCFEQLPLLLRVLGDRLRTAPGP